MRLDCTNDNDNKQQKRAIMVMVEKFNATANNNMHAKKHGSMEKVTTIAPFLIKIQISIIYSNHRHFDQMVLSHQLKYDFYQCNSIQLMSNKKSSSEKFEEKLMAS